MLRGNGKQKNFGYENRGGVKMLLIGFIMSVIINIWYARRMYKIRSIAKEMSRESKKVKSELDKISEAWENIDRAEASKIYIKR
jgi:hypothetical protein